MLLLRQYASATRQLQQRQHYSQCASVAIKALQCRGLMSNAQLHRLRHAPPPNSRAFHSEDAYYVIQTSRKRLTKAVVAHLHRSALDNQCLSAAKAAEELDTARTVCHGLCAVLLRAYDPVTQQLMDDFAALEPASSMRAENTYTKWPVSRGDGNGDNSCAMPVLPPKRTPEETLLIERRFLTMFGRLLVRAQFAPLTRGEYLQADALQPDLSLPASTDWDKIDSGMLQRFNPYYYVSHTTPGVKEHWTQMAPSFADKLLVFHRGRGVMERSGFFYSDKLDELYARGLRGTGNLIKGLGRRILRVGRHSVVGDADNGSSSTTTTPDEVDVSHLDREGMSSMRFSLQRFLGRVTLREPTLRSVVLVYRDRRVAGARETVARCTSAVLAAAARGVRQMLFGSATFADRVVTRLEQSAAATGRSLATEHRERVQRAIHKLEQHARAVDATASKAAAHAMGTTQEQQQAAHTGETQGGVGVLSRLASALGRSGNGSGNGSATSGSTAGDGDKSSTAGDAKRTPSGAPSTAAEREALLQELVETMEALAAADSASVSPAAAAAATATTPPSSSPSSSTPGKSAPTSLRMIHPIAHAARETELRHHLEQAGLLPDYLGVTSGLSSTRDMAQELVDAALETGSDKRKGPKGLASMGRKTWLERISDGAGVDRTAAVKIFVREHKNVPIADLQLGFPALQLKMKRLDRTRLALLTAASAGVFTQLLIVDVWSWGGIVAMTSLVVVLMRLWFRYSVAKVYLQHRAVNDSVDHLQSVNRSTLASMALQAADHEAKTALVAYAALWCMRESLATAKGLNLIGSAEEAAAAHNADVDPFAIATEAEESEEESEVHTEIPTGTTAAAPSAGTGWVPMVSLEELMADLLQQLPGAEEPAGRRLRVRGALVLEPLLRLGLVEEGETTVRSPPDAEAGLEYAFGDGEVRQQGGGSNGNGDGTQRIRVYRAVHPQIVARRLRRVWTEMLVAEESER